MNVQLIAAPSEEPVGLGEVKEFCRVDVRDDDALLNGLILAARTNVETWLRKKLCTQTWKVLYDGFSSKDTSENGNYDYSSVLKLPFAPLQSVTSVKYYDTNGTLQTFNAAKYNVDTLDEPARIGLKQGEVWPVVEYKKINAVEIECVVGYGGKASVPDGIKLGIKLLVSHWYDTRTPALQGGTVATIPLMLEHLLMPFRTMTFV